MLVLSRRIGEKLVLKDGYNRSIATITVVQPHHGQTRLGLDCPEDVQVYREEIMGRYDLREIPRQDVDVIGINKSLRAAMDVLKKLDQTDQIKAIQGEISWSLCLLAEVTK